MRASNRLDENRTEATPAWSLRPGQLAAAIACLGLLAAGCGSASHTSSSSAAQSPSSFIAAAYRYAGCMRHHGVSNFPDPQIVNQAGQHGIRQIVSGEIVSAPQFKTAETACRGIEPAPTNVNPAQQRARTQDMLAFAKCLRRHGIPNFPDPTSQGQLTRQMVAAAGVDLHAPVVLTAAKACIGTANGAITGADVERAVNGGQ